MDIAAPAAPLSLTLEDLSETERFAVFLGAHLRAGDCLLLEGPVGAGKTSFARALIQSLLPHHEDVPSPTFTLVQTYETPNFEIWHCDLYRLTTSEELIELGLEEALSDAVCLIEWPERLGALTPASAQTLAFEPIKGGAARRVTLRGDARWANVAFAERPAP
ncbi:MAG: tRNA (adenosine(37)-N6)-threonylcarbamoyltransferase complex ATPase subunit type 1 TsaE [Pseudomonadota bacterium]